MFVFAVTQVTTLPGLSLPHAFGTESTLFAASDALVRVLHLALYVDASRRGNAAWSAIAGFAVTVLIGMALLLAGLQAWMLTGAIAVLLGAMCAAEARPRTSERLLDESQG